MLFGVKMKYLKFFENLF